MRPEHRLCLGDLCVNPNAASPPSPASAARPKSPGASDLARGSAAGSDVDFLSRPGNVAAMLLAMIAATLVSLSAAAVAQGNTRQTRSLFCSSELGDPDRPRGFVRLEVDRAHRPLQRTLALWDREYRASWKFGTRDFDARRPPAELEVHAIKLSRDTQFPVTAILRFDGATIWRATFDRPTTNVVVPSDRRTNTPVSLHPGVEIVTGPGEVPSLFGVRNAEVVLLSAEGSPIATRPLPMPDWSGVENRVSEAFALVEDERRRRRCKPDIIVTAS